MYLTPETRNALTDLGPCTLRPGRKRRGGHATVIAEPLPPQPLEGVILVCGMVILVTDQDTYTQLLDHVIELGDGPERMDLVPFTEDRLDSLCNLIPATPGDQK